ncbi:LacI family transcriptional regulator [Longibacter salinarum]|uniref:LacI family transcriptional regulator n=1 Tax=Longibacter salinarum TaxID=1850348 RepID=A0A2A8D046_9BACT|nr:LacI family DNA-binding transcriptional regulator [Longibacter salinarum]PEN14231.1 LacI family transcriptional regulator [Longibacter salinarum]
MATLEDVARQAGVSVSTVSRTINRPDMVNADTRTRVEAAIDDLEYRPNRVARRLRRLDGRAHMLGLLIPDIQNPFYSDVVRGVEDVAYARDAAVILCNTDETSDREQFYVDVLKAESADGVILPPIARSDLNLDIKNIGMPLVFFDRRISDASVDTVVVDNERGARDIVNHLIELGHRRIGLINGPETIATSAERAAGYRRALHDHGIPFDDELVREGRPTRDAGKALTDELLRLDHAPSALFAANNQLALGVLESVREHDLRVPEDIAVVTFDDAPWAKLLDPPLTTVRQPSYEMGRRAAELLFDRIASPDRAAALIVLQPELVVRASCGSGMDT